MHRSKQSQEQPASQDEQREDRMSGTTKTPEAETCNPTEMNQQIWFLRMMHSGAFEALIFYICAQF